MTCAWFQPQVSFASDEIMEPAIGILNIAPLSFMKVAIEINFTNLSYCIGITASFVLSEL